jgi:hypothetical protein
MLEALMRASPRVLTREELERAIWHDAPPDSDALRSHLHLLRAAIDKPFAVPLLQTLRGIGWQIAASERTTTDHDAPTVACASASRSPSPDWARRSACCLIVGIWFAAHDVSQRLMDQTLKAELDDYMARRARNPNSLPPASAKPARLPQRPGAARQRHCRPACASLHPASTKSNSTAFPGAPRWPKAMAPRVT